LTAGPRPHAAGPAPPGAGREEPATLEALERQAIASALERHQGHRRHAAQELGIGERTLYDKLKRYGLK